MLINIVLPYVELTSRSSVHSNSGGLSLLFVTGRPTLICVNAQSCPTLFDPMNYRVPGSAVHGIFEATILEWVAIFFS